ncbi:DUF5641 domain-containing protein [Trichonephila inaurata madagascariensis]|uniref:DUF5641 domain-containing protein n=1 Tax=Trichonephila inaurata madagascariensis TaxID=2747483 RepID=A0A8X6WQD9_9ARAC|nr:DUF5641 domain-containing protein [Trichonephila inaurata madagascariensis]
MKNKRWCDFLNLLVTYPSNAFTSKIPNLEVLNKKLLDNSVLNGLERAFLIECLKNFSNPLKRKNGTAAVNHDASPKRKNCKVQISPFELNYYETTSSQTDELKDYQPPLNNTSLTNDVRQSKKLTDLEKVDLATDLMLKSFDKRRTFILLEKPLVSFVKEKFPLLFSCTERAAEDRFCETLKEKELSGVKD